MSIPPTVKVGPHTYQIRLHALENLSGDCDTDRLRIRIDRSMRGSQRRDTLLHEVLHAITSMTGLDHELGDSTDEAVARRLAPALLDVLRANPKFTEYLLSD